MVRIRYRPKRLSNARSGRSLAAGAIYFFVWKGLGFPQDKSYYVVVLTFLLIHYFYDHILFRDFRGFQTSPRLV